MKRTSKYLGKEFDNGWVCTHVGIASVQGKRAKAVGHINYYYVFERMTSDNKAQKLIRLNSSQAAAVYQGKISVEDLVEKRVAKDENAFTRKVSYHFIRR